MDSHGTRFLDDLISSGIAASGIRFRNARLMAPITPLKANRIANWKGLGSPASVTAATKNVMKLPVFCTPASRERYFPRSVAGTSRVIHGSQAQLEIPREMLKQQSNARIKTSRVWASRNLPVNGTSAIAKIKSTLVPHPAYTKRLNPTLDI